jgi:hypothetical protein
MAAPAPPAPAPPPKPQLTEEERVQKIKDAMEKEFQDKEEARRKWIGLKGKPPPWGGYNDSKWEDKLGEAGKKMYLDYYMPYRIPAEVLRKMPVDTKEQLVALRDAIEDQTNSAGVIDGVRAFDFDKPKTGLGQYGEYWLDTMFWRFYVPELNKSNRTWDWVEKQIGRLEDIEEAEAEERGRVIAAEEKRKMAEEEAAEEKRKLAAMTPEKREKLLAERAARAAMTPAELRKEREEQERMWELKRLLEREWREADRARSVAYFQSGARETPALLKAREVEAEALRKLRLDENTPEGRAELNQLAVDVVKRARQRSEEKEAARMAEAKKTADAAAAYKAAVAAKQAAERRAMEEAAAERARVKALTPAERAAEEYKKKYGVRQAVPGNWTKEQLLLHEEVLEERTEKPTQYWVNKRGDVLDHDGDWVGRLLPKGYSDYDRIDRDAKPPPDFEQLEAA